MQATEFVAVADDSCGVASDIWGFGEWWNYRPLHMDPAIVFLTHIHYGVSVVSKDTQTAH